jgi:hypothetical protein
MDDLVQRLRADPAIELDQTEGINVWADPAPLFNEAADRIEILEQAFDAKVARVDVLEKALREIMEYCLSAIKEKTPLLAWAIAASARRALEGTK